LAAAAASPSAAAIVRRFVRENGLALFILALFVGTVVAQSLAGQHAENANLAEHGEPTIQLADLRAGTARRNRLLRLTLLRAAPIRVGGRTFGNR
jgi:hypothetical protein